MGDEQADARSFRGARFVRADFSGAVFRDCDLRNVKIADAMLIDVSIGGDVRNVVVNDVDITDFVEAELDRRHPSRVRVRQMTTPDDYRATWAMIEDLWAGTVERAQRLPEELRQQRVDDEWSFVETMRHLIFATDAWASRTVHDEPMPYHRLGLTHTAYPPKEAAALGIDVDAHPSFDEVIAVRDGRMAVVRGIVDELTDDELQRGCARAPAPGYPDEPYTVGECLRVVMAEECEHHRYATRDLAVLEARA